MVLDDLQAPAGEETGAGESNALKILALVDDNNDTPVGRAAGVFVSGWGQRVNHEEISQWNR